MNNRKFVYLSNKDFDGTVYQTQILDWLHLFSENGIAFDLYQGIHIKQVSGSGFVREQLSQIKSKTNLYRGFFFFFPSRGIFVYLNVLVIYLKLIKYSFKYREILIFSRGLFGKEIKILKKIVPGKLIFYYDARAASAEENKYLASKKGDFSVRKQNIIAHVYETEFTTVDVADKVFVVSNALKDYFIKNCITDSSKFINYPCLSDSCKFYFDVELRSKIRAEMKISAEDKIFLYAGGINEGWHVSNKMFQFFEHVNKHSQQVHFLFLTKDSLSVQKIVENFPSLQGKLIYKSVSNSEMVKYLNAADYGILFRENSIMNNVASPTKFAEYILCGLPVIISEGVGDYTSFCKQKNVGYVLESSVLEHIENFDAEALLQVFFDRAQIAAIGKKYLSKESILCNIVEQFKM